MKIFTLLIVGFSFVFGAVDINSASAEELTSLKGIGEKKAQAIIAYREAHCFKKVDDIVHVKGIGEKFLAKNKGELEAKNCK